MASSRSSLVELAVAPHRERQRADGAIADAHRRDRGHRHAHRRAPTSHVDWTEVAAIRIVVDVDDHPVLAGEHSPDRVERVVGQRLELARAALGSGPARRREHDPADLARRLEQVDLARVGDPRHDELTDAMEQLVGLERR